MRFILILVSTYLLICATVAILKSNKSHSFEKVFVETLETSFNRLLKALGLFISRLFNIVEQSLKNRERELKLASLPLIPLLEINIIESVLNNFFKTPTFSNQYIDGKANVRRLNFLTSGQRHTNTTSSIIEIALNQAFLKNGLRYNFRVMFDTNGNILISM
jgi:hypothetical protein